MLMPMTFGASVPWETPDDLPPEVTNKLDWLTEANSFNMLFYEY